MTKERKRWGWYLAGALLVLLVVSLLRPSPLVVETGRVLRGPLIVSVVDDGMTRIKERYLIASPIFGRVRRIELESGDSVTAGETVLAVIEPNLPEFLDARAQATVEASVGGAESVLERARADLERSGEADQFAQSEFTRAQQMRQTGIISQSEFDRAELQASLSRKELRAAEHSARIAEFQLKQAQAALIQVVDQAGESPSQEPFVIVAPTDGRVLRRMVESSVVVQPGTTLMEIGDPTQLEIVTDVLSSDAVKIRPGNRVQIEHWGGAEPLAAQVRRVEPAAFTKVSVLGVEEQRVWVIADFVDPLSNRDALGDGFHVESRIVIWEGAEVLKIPSAALFRSGETWSVFRIRDGVVGRQTIEIGRQGEVEVELIAGLEEGDEVVLYPSDHVSDGARVATGKG